MASDRFRLADPDAPFSERYAKQFQSGHEVDSVPDALLSNSDWMVANTVLAYIPLGFAYLVFVRGIEWAVLRWLAVAAFVAFLPNALYVVTDLIHLAAEGQSLSWSPAVWLALVPVYVVFVVAGVLAYAASLSLFRDWVSRGRGQAAGLAAVVTLHVACCCGIYLGRVLRLNSWEFVTAPLSVVDGVVTMATRIEALAYVVTLFVAGGLVTVALAPLQRRLLRIGSYCAGASLSRANRVNFGHADHMARHRMDFEPLDRFHEPPRSMVERWRDRRKVDRDHRLRNSAVRWRRWGIRGPRVDAYGDGQWHMGLVVNGVQRLRLILNEDRVSELPLERFAFDPTGEEQYGPSVVEALADDLRSATVPRDTERWMADYVAAMLALCDECARKKADGIYFAGP